MVNSRDFCFSSSQTLLSWHQTEWKRLASHFAMPHAQLSRSFMITGPEGDGKVQFASQLIARLLCRRPTEQGEACRQCDACQLLESNTHPDFKLVQLVDKSRVIKIDQIRSLNDFANQTALHGELKVCAVYPADKLNKNAANAFLKNLEEPAPGTVFLLLTDRPGAVLPTIRSRCLRIQLSLPDTQQAEAYLSRDGGMRENIVQHAHSIEQGLETFSGSPLLLEEAVENGFFERQDAFVRDLRSLLKQDISICKVAQNWKRHELLECLDWLYLILADLIKLAVSGQTLYIKRKQNERFLRAILQRSNLDRLFSMLDKVQIVRIRVLDGGVQMNEQLVMESMLVKWCQLVKR